MFFYHLFVAGCVLRSSWGYAPRVLGQNHGLDRFIRALFSKVAVATLIDRFTSGVQECTGYEVTNL